MNRLLSIIGLAAATLGLARSMLERPRTRAHPLFDLIRDRFGATRREIVALGIAMGVAAIIAPLGLAMSRGWASWAPLRPTSSTYTLLAVLTLGIKFLWAATEELMFRGGLLPQLARRFGPWNAVWISAVLFPWPISSAPVREPPIS